MPKLPSFEDLGALPNAAGQPANARLEGALIQRGVGALARGQQTIGEAVTRGAGLLASAADNFGQGVASLDKPFDRLNEQQYAQAHADYLSKRIDLDAKYANDQDYATLKDRYSADLDKLRSSAGEGIDNGRLKDRFFRDTQVDHSRALAGIDNQAHNLEGNANIAYVTQQGEKFIDQATATNDPETRAQIIASQRGLIEGLRSRGFVNPVQALNMQQQWAHRYALADGIARADTDPIGVINDLRTAPGSDDAITNRIIQAESGGRANARNPNSSAAGTGQFIDGTWLDLVKKNRPDLAADQSDADILAMRADPKLSREMVGKYLEENRASLKAQGIEATPGALYLSHFLGPKAAAAVLSADDGAPVYKALAAALGPARAAAMVQSNPSVLAGRQAGSVREWADKQMGGAAAGGGAIYDILEPAQRAMLLDHAMGKLNAQQTSDLSRLRARVADTTSEAMLNGIAKNPVSQTEFISALGVEKGQQAFKNYQGELKLGADVKRVANMSQDELGALFKEYEPQAGSEGYAEAAKRQEQLFKAVSQVEAEKAKDPAAFAIMRLPAAGDAWKKLQGTLSSDQSTDDGKRAAARDFAQQTLIEQERIGVSPLTQRITPKEYGEEIAAQWNNPPAAGGPGNVQQRIEGEAKLWGDNWPRVFREIAPKLDATIRVIAAGVEPAAGKALIENFHADEQKILGTQYATKKTDLDHAVTDALAPIARTFVGTEADQARRDYQAAASKLTAIYVSRGADVNTAARDAVSQIVGSKYDLGDTYRVPHDAKVSADQVAAGIGAARADMSKLDVALERDNFGGLSGDYLKTATLAALARDGQWVTAPDEKGLMLVYKDGFWPRASDPRKPFMLTWDELAALGAHVKAGPSESDIVPGT